MRLTLALIIAFTLQLTPANAEPTTLPKVKVVSVKKLFHNGEHNAFTDMIKFKDKYYLTFRTCPNGHMVFSSSRILILCSDDAKTWKQVGEFSVPQRDVRDPHFLIFKEKLFVYSGTWFCGKTLSPKSRTVNDHLGYAVTSIDGANWSQPQMLEGTYGHYVWRAATDGKKAYLCAYRIKNFDPASKKRQSALLESEDGFTFTKAGAFMEEKGGETAFLFEPNGDLLAIDRFGSDKAWLVRSKAPYKKFQRKEMKHFIGGPLLVKWGEHYLVGGRDVTSGRAKTSIHWLVNDELKTIATFPSGGDCSYPGFVQLSPTKAVVSYYSSHEKDKGGKAYTAIYLAELEIHP